MPNTLDDHDWMLLLQRIRLGKCTPFLGAGACHGVLPLGADIAQDLASRFGYPLEDSGDLERVAQFLSVKFDPSFPKERIPEYLRTGTAPDFSSPDEPHGLLADLPLPVYLTTNYDDFMVRALLSRNREPLRVICRWNRRLRKEGKQTLEATIARPLVFHLHGVLENQDSLVLTEDDYLDFIVNISRTKRLIPPRIEEAMAGSSLLFLGYRLADWSFRVIFRSLVDYLERSTERTHVSVQLVPSGDSISEEQRQEVQKYLSKYFDQQRIRVYWGTCREFILELRRRWEEFERDLSQ